MPVANCIVSAELSGTRRPESDLIELWADAAGLSSAEMTVNIVVASAQYGKGCDLQAHLLLPSLWSESDISKLQLGLSKALSEFFKLEEKQILVTTQILESGRVVEGGKKLTW